MKRNQVFQHATLSESHLRFADVVEKRQHTRVPVSVGVQIVDIKTKVHIIGRATDFGVGGCYVDTMNTFPEGTAVEVFFHWENRTLHLRALVSYAVNDRSIGMGLAFTSTSEEGATVLEWVTGLGAAPPSDTAQEPARDPETLAQKKPTRAYRLEEVVDVLLTLLIRKEVLTESEGAELRDRISA